MLLFKFEQNTLNIFHIMAYRATIQPSGQSYTPSPQQQKEYFDRLSQKLNSLIVQHQNISDDVIREINSAITNLNSIVTSWNTQNIQYSSDICQPLCDLIQTGFSFLISCASIQPYPQLSEQFINDILTNGVQVLFHMCLAHFSDEYIRSITIRSLCTVTPIYRVWKQRDLVLQQVQNINQNLLPGSSQFKTSIIILPQLKVFLTPQLIDDKSSIDTVRSAMQLFLLV